MREQYLSLNRDQNGGGVTVNSLHQTLVDHGTDVSRTEVADLLVTAGVAATADSALTRQNIQFNDFKKLIHLTGLGDDARAYDFARSVQPLRTAQPSAAMQQSNGLGEAGEKHVPKHLSQAAGGSASHAVPNDASPRKRVTRNKNMESGAIGGIVAANCLSLAHDAGEDVMHDLGGGTSYLSSKHEGKHVNLKYRQHDHIDAMGLANGGKGHVTMGHSGAVGLEQHSHHGDIGRRGSKRHVVHGNHGDLNDHIGDRHVLERRPSVSNEQQEEKSEKSASRRGSGRRNRKQVTGKIANQQVPISKTPRHLKADDWFRHDTHLKTAASSRPASSPSSASRSTLTAASPSVVSTGVRSPSKVWRMTSRPPASPAARQAAEKKFSTQAYAGAAGVSAFQADSRMHHSRTKTGRKHVPRADNNLFQNMQYPSE